MKDVLPCMETVCGTSIEVDDVCRKVNKIGRSVAKDRSLDGVQEHVGSLFNAENLPFVRSLMRQYKRNVAVLNYCNIVIKVAREEGARAVSNMEEQLKKMKQLLRSQNKRIRLTQVIVKEEILD